MSSAAGFQPLGALGTEHSRPHWGIMVLLQCRTHKLESKNTQVPMGIIVCLV